MTRTRIHPDDAPDLQADSEASTHAAAADPHTGYVREADANWVDLTDGGASTLHTHAGGSGAPDDADYLVGTAHAGLSAEIVVGATPSGELGGTWASPTVDATHSGSTHAATQTAAEATAAAALTAHDTDTTAVHGIADTSALSLTSHDHDADYEATGAIATHAGLADPHTGYRLESADHSHATTGLQAGTIAHTALTSVGIDDHHARDHAINAAVHTGTLDDAQIPAGIARDAEVATAVSDHAALADPHTGYRLESADHTHASTGIQAGQVAHSALSGITANDHHAQAHAADHLPTGTDPENKFSQSTTGTLDQAIANTETVVLAKVFAANELAAGQVYRFEAWFTKAGTNAASAVIRIRIGTTTLTGNIAATLTPPTNALAVPGKIEGWLQIVAGGAGGTARGNLQQFVHLAAVTITSAVGPATATVAVNTTTANQRVELTFISGNAANTYTFRGAVMYRVA